MEANHKKILKAISLELRHLLEGYYDSDGKWQPGDLEQRLAAIGVRRDREPVPVDELAHLSDDDKNARTVVDAYLQLRDEADVSREEAVAEFVRETAYTWANRLLCLRCMEARELIDEVILQKEAYGGRSLEHHRLAQRDPEVCSGEDDGLFAVLDKVFTDQTEHLPLLFDPQSPGVALRPSPAVLKRCLALLSGIVAVRSLDPATAEVFQAPDALGWAYQYWNTEEKDRVFEKVRTQKGAKIAGADIIPATQLYTEPYMVRFLVQNSLGATWMGMYPDSTLYEKWEYYVRDADRALVEKKPMAEITFLDPACGSGHFLIEAFDLYYDMYIEEGELTEAEDICGSILEKNLFGIDIDARAIQIAEAALWMKAAERAFDFQGVATNLVAAVASHLKGDLWEDFLTGFEREPSVARVLRKFGQTMEHIDELGSLARPEEELRTIIHEEHATWERQIRQKTEANFLFPEMTEDAVSGHLPFHEISDEEFGDRLLYRARSAIDAFFAKASEEQVLQDQFLSHETSEGFRLFALLSRAYDIVAANPPYMTIYTMGDSLREFLNHYYPTTCYDLFSAFLERSTQLTADNGAIAYVAQSSFLTIRNYTGLREVLLERATPSVVAHLGTGAFADISGAKVNVLLYVGRGSNALREATFLDLRRTTNKSQALLESDPTVRTYRVTPASFPDIPRCPFIYSLSGSLRKLLTSTSPFLEHGKAYLGLKTANNARFYRMAWEVPYCSEGDRRWKPLVSETNSKPYFWDNTGCISFRDGDIAYYRDHFSAQIYNESLWDRPGLTFGAAAGRGFDVKLLESRTMVLNSSNLILVKDPADLEFLVGVLNTSLYRVLMGLLNPTINNTPGDVHRLPWPEMSGDTQSVIALQVREMIQAIKAIRSDDASSGLFSWSRSGTTLRGCMTESLTKRIKQQQSVIAAKAMIEKQVTSTLLSCDEDVDFVLDWHGIAPHHVVSGGIADGQTITVKPIHADCLLERVSIERNLQPESLSLETLPPEVVDAEFRAFGETWFEACCLSLLGHRWPKQIEVEELLPEWADPDGIIPLTEGADEAKLLDRVRDQIGTGFKGGDVASIEREFAEIMGKPLDKWLTMEFFKHHTKQFKKRPIAWQIQSSKFTARKKPAFACLVYYHKLDGDLLPKIRNQYVGPLRSRLETELRSIESVSADTRSDRQQGRRGELEDQIDELRDFDATLQKVITEGFASKELAKIVKDEPLDNWCSLDGTRPEPESQEALLQQESSYFPDINDGVRVNIVPLQKAGLLAADVLAKKDLDKAIADRAQWRADERRWCRENKLPQPGWWPEAAE